MKVSDLIDEVSCLAGLDVIISKTDGKQFFNEIKCNCNNVPRKVMKQKVITIFTVGELTYIISANKPSDNIMTLITFRKDEIYDKN